jgi:arylsulfatase A-like enzyme
MDRSAASERIRNPGVKSPNILLICCDEMRGDAMGWAGNPVIQTPHLDRLAAEGAAWDRCYATQPTCTPSRASFFTGCYASSVRSRMVGCWTPDDPRFLPHAFHQAGYHTAAIGKIHLVPQHEEPAWQKERSGKDGHYFGFREVDLVNGHGDNCFGPGFTPWLEERCPDWRTRRQSRKRLREAVGSCYEWPLTPDSHSGNYLVEKTRAFLSRPQERPFFLNVSLADPHYPFTVPEPFASMYRPEDMPPPVPDISHSRHPAEMEVLATDADPVHVIGTHTGCAGYTLEDWQTIKAIYYGMISQLDHHVGQILEALEQSGHADDTVVVFLSDHGDYLGDHGIYGKGLSYEGSIRVPLLFRGPGIQPGLRVGGVGTLLDLAPTLLDFAGIPEPEGMQGISCQSLLCGQGQAARDAVLIENDDDRTPMRMRTLVAGDWKLTVFAGRESGQLYHLPSDPQELHNRWEDPEYADIRNTLRQRLLEEVILGVDAINGRKQSPAPPIPKFQPAISVNF